LVRSRQADSRALKSFGLPAIVPAAGERRHTHGRQRRLPLDGASTFSLARRPPKCTRRQRSHDPHWAFCQDAMMGLYVTGHCTARAHGDGRARSNAGYIYIRTWMDGREPCMAGQWLASRAGRLPAIYKLTDGSLVLRTALPSDRVVYVGKIANLGALEQRGVVATSRRL
jgi:hypothetical protein